MIVEIAWTKAELDGLGEGDLTIKVEKQKRNPTMAYHVVFQPLEKEEMVLRTFYHLVGAVRSWRRFCLLSDEITSNKKKAEVENGK